MIQFFSEKPASHFLRKDISDKDITEVRAYKYITKKRSKNMEYIFNISTQELLIIQNTNLNTLIKQINSGIKVPEKTELLLHNFIVDKNESSRKLSQKITRLWQKSSKYNANDKTVASYLIFTTTDCNARCYYCYENGCKKEFMTLDTASALVDYMKRHYTDNGKALSIKWFGGEPLYNIPVIDYITGELTKSNIPYTSRMISNGILLNAETIDKAIHNWHLTSTQITLDGTREIYNKTKNYIYSDIDAYSTVLNNIQLAVQAGLKIRLRFNVSLTNIDDLIQLSKDLRESWSEEIRSKLSGYAHLLFQLEENKDDYNDEFIAKYAQLEDEIAVTFCKKSGRSTSFKMRKGCMTTNQHQVAVLPSGDLCSCEHFNEEESWGSIFNDDTKPEVITKKWAEYTHLENEDCAKCLYYPLCYYLAHCPASRQLCNPMYKQLKGKAVQANLDQAISKYKNSLKTKK